MTIKRDKLAATDFSDIATGRRLAPVHPGEILAKEFIEAKGISRYRVAKAMGVQQRMVAEITEGSKYHAKA